MVKSQHHATLNIEPHEIDSWSLHLGGATAPLCTKVDRNLIQLQGCWKSDAVICCLHVLALPWVNKFTEQYLKLAIFPSCQRSTRRAHPHVTIQTQMTCPMTILILSEPTPLNGTPFKTLIPLPLCLQIHHLHSICLRPPWKQAPHLPKPLPHLLAQDCHSFLPLVFKLLTMTPTVCCPSPLLDALPFPSWATGAKEIHTHMCNLFCDADAVGLSSTGLPPIT